MRTKKDIKWAIEMSLIAILLIVIAFASRTTPVIDVSEPASTESAEVVIEEKPRNLTPQEMIEQKCEEYGIDSAIPVAIARLETGHFKSKAFREGNNVGGMSINEVPMTFESLEEGVEAFVSNLAKNYYGKGLDTVEEIGAKYCPANKEHWAKTVKQLMVEY